MPTFKFRLESLLKYRKSRRDMCLQVLAQLLAEDQALVEKRKQIELTQETQRDELRLLGERGAVNVDAATSRRYYIGQLTGESQLVSHNRESLAQRIGLCRKALAQAEREVKVLEKLEEKQLTEFRYQQHRREGRELDETWQAIHHGKGSQ